MLAFETAEKFCGLDTEMAADEICFVATIQYKLYRDKEAAEWFGKAQKKYTGILGPHHRKTLDSIHFRGQALVQSKTYEEGLHWLQIAHKGETETLEEADPKIVETLDWIVSAHRKLGDSQAARGWLQQAFATAIIEPHCQNRMHCLLIVLETYEEFRMVDETSQAAELWIRLFAELPETDSRYILRAKSLLPTGMDPQTKTLPHITKDREVSLSESTCLLGSTTTGQSGASVLSSSVEYENEQGDPAPSC